MRQIAIVGRLLVALEPLQFRMLTLPVVTADDGREAGIEQRCAQRPLVVQKLMAPAAKGAVECETGLHLFRFRHAEAIVGDPDPVEVGRGQTQHAVIAQHATALAHQFQRVRVREMLDEMLGEDQ